MTADPSRLVQLESAVDEVLDGVKQRSYLVRGRTPNITKSLPEANHFVFLTRGMDDGAYIKVWVLLHPDRLNKTSQALERSYLN